MMILSRLLTPAQVGLFGVATGLMGFLHIARDFGVRDYVIQERELTSERVAAARALIFATSWSIAVLVFLSSGLIAKFFRHDDLRPVLWVLASSFLVVPFGAMTQAFLARDLEQGALLRISLVSSIVGTGISIAVAYAGYGAISLAWGALASVIATTLIARMYRPAILRVRPSFRELHRVLRFSTFSLGHGLLTQWHRAAPSLILGKLQSLEAVGLFSRAMGISEMFNQNAAKPVWSIVYPMLTRSIREGTYRPEIAVRLIALITGIALPAIAFVAVFAEEVIVVLFGAQWEAAAAPARWLAIGAAASVLSMSLIQILKAFGWVGRNAAVTSFTAISLPLVVLILAKAPLWVIGAGLGVVKVADMLIRARLVSVCAGLNGNHWRQALFGSVMVVVPVCGVAALIRWYGMEHDWSRLAILAASVVPCAFCWLAALWLVRHEWRNEAQRMWGLTRQRLLTGRG